jgi:hypothetical protein
MINAVFFGGSSADGGRPSGPQPYMEGIETPPPFEAPEQFLPYPHAYSEDGYMITGSWIDMPVQNWSARVAGEWGYDFNDMPRSGITAMLDSSGGWGLDAAWHTYFESLPLGGTDEVDIGDVNVLWRVLSAPQAQCHLGVGMNWFDDDAHAEFGANFTLRADYFPRAPWVLSGEIDWGTLGETGMFHGAASVGVMIHRFELFGGYDYRQIGSTELEGPLVGLRLWF